MPKQMTPRAAAPSAALPALPWGEGFLLVTVLFIAVALL